jgi:hypothetical protein
VLGDRSIEVASKRFKIGIERLADLDCRSPLDSFFKFPAKPFVAWAIAAARSTLYFPAPLAFIFRKGTVCLNFLISFDLSRCRLPENLDRSGHRANLVRSPRMGNG